MGILMPVLRRTLWVPPGGGGGEPVLPSLYLGQVATKSTIPSNRSTTNKQANSRSHHIARDNITSLQIELPNWYWIRSSAGPEQGSGGNITYSASIEYPEGVFTQVLFGGATSGVCADNTALLSDAVAVTIPDGASFWVRTYANAVGAIVFLEGNVGYSQRDAANGELYEYAASGITNKTMGGTLVDNGATSNPIFRPTAIVAQTRKPSVLIIGDSRDWGFTDTHDGSGDLGDLARSIGPSYGYINAACAGDKFSAFNTASARRRELQQYVSHVIIGDAINSLRSGGSGQNKTAATVLAELQTTLEFFTDKVRFTTTCGGPQTTSTDSWATLENQTYNANWQQVVAYNDAIRAGVANSAGFFEIADWVESSRNSGKWWVNGTALATTTDGLHATQASYLRIKNSGAVNPALLTRAGL
ncbi:hypothetical protein Lo5R7ANS_62 [Mesorhizobium phage vB_MloP_Lo5R7ANS]|uniref:Uncharacterized protein n=1 Tax=Mesorhizobium phage vB_MloP_Lo5R7ANS TaxID=1527771 RepID=A0A076YL80_9CAUD|nr:lysophospholipase L1-like esterase [Mesorhizobium phage vB_MloP_Lo5R7ANS]AIK68532.1 hypothetical protein Lo5R7ANS_62 [Mesorhizobium phage vB_MloP_Lo5R7ANS]